MRKSGGFLNDMSNLSIHNASTLPLTPKPKTMSVLPKISADVENVDVLENKIEKDDGK